MNIGGQWVSRNQFRDIEQIRKTTVGSQESEINSEGLHRYFGTNYGGNVAMEYRPNKNDFLSIVQVLIQGSGMQQQTIFLKNI